MIAMEAEAVQMLICLETIVVLWFKSVVYKSF